MAELKRRDERADVGEKEGDLHGYEAVAELKLIGVRQQPAVGSEISTAMKPWPN
ncbi:hypothetical protein FRUB_06445 [Fimbriiglobus ruber]|uniref:Uncharacterized protein n=1 Tax=Fimbriiglobus ruber TaxID=1908690 RepID=A0A225DLK7_9BACT|nr:hypothetical protein FRUB_06445 [Fimbriiglobus ruber]